MSDTVETLIDELVQALDDGDTDQARNLIGAIGDQYDELRTDEEKRIRQATILRGNGALSQDEEEQLGQLVNTAASTEMKRGAFLIRAVAAVRAVEQETTPEEDFEDAVTEVKAADEDLETEVEQNESTIEESEIPPSIEIIKLRLDPSTVGLDQTSQLNATIGNVGNESANEVELTISPAEGASVSESRKTLGTVVGDEDRTETFDVEAEESGDQRIRMDVTSANAGSDADSKTLTVEELDDPSLQDYTDQDSIVRLSGLREAVQDWRETNISDDLLETVTDAWRTQQEVE